MPLINSAWENSFGRLSKNKTAIAERGWNPLNRNIMTNVDVRATMTSSQKQKENEQSSDIILPSLNKSNDFNNEDNFNTSTTSSDRREASLETVSESLSSMRDSINFSSGTAAFCIDALLSNYDKMQARERIKQEYNKGKLIKDILKQARKVTSGIVFKAGTTRLGKTVFDVAQDNIREKINIANNKIKKMEKEYLQNKMKAEDIFSKKHTIEKMTIAKLKAVCKPHKRKADGKMPTKKEDLFAKYREWSARPAPDFLLMEEELPTVGFSKMDHSDVESDNDDINNNNYEVVNSAVV